MKLSKEKESISEQNTWFPPLQVLVALVACKAKPM
jgi:hypothetical protein